MRRTTSVIALLIAIVCVSCGPKELRGTCDFNTYQQHHFAGYVNLCNANPQQGTTFLAEALVFAIDSTLFVEINSMEPDEPFTYVDTLKISCAVAEDFYFHKIIDPTNNLVIGEINFQASHIGFEIDYPVCSEGSRFEGAAQ